MEKMKAQSITQLAAIAERLGVFSPDKEAPQASE
jgi:hypothetical protein